MYPNTLTLNNGVRIPQLGAISLPKTANPLPHGDQRTGGVCHQRHHRDDAAGLDVDGVIVPVLAKENIVVIMGESRGKGAQSIPSGSLYDLFYKDKVGGQAVLGRQT